jgi:streptogramin lyase
MRELKGVPAQWRVFAAEPSAPVATESEPPTGPDPQQPGGRRSRTRLWIAAAAVIVLAAVALAIAHQGGGNHHRLGARPTVASSRSTTSPASPGPLPLPDNAVVTFDVRSGNVRTIVKGLVPASADAPARQIEAGEGGVWVNSAITLQHVDPATGSLVGQIDAQPLVSTIAVGPGALWTGGNLGIVRVSPATDRTEASIPFDTGAARPIAIGVQPDGAVWLLVSDGRLVRIDSRSNQIDRRYDLGSPADDLAVTRDALWALDLFHQQVLEIDPSNGKIEHRIPVPGDNVSRIVVGAGTIWAMDSRAGFVTPVDPVSHVAGSPIRVGEDPVDIVFGAGAVWVADRGDGTITRIDPRDHHTRMIRVGGSIAAIAVDPSGTELWVYLTQE